MNAIHERTKTGTVTEYVYGPTGIIAYGSASTWKYVIKDHLGSTRAVVDGTTVTGYDYSAFGSILAPVTPNTSYMYTGQEYDKTSGLHNYKARMYDSDLMRFYGMDPAGAFASPYDYVINNPITQNDPSGELPFWAVVAIYTAVHVGADAARGDIDSWKDLERSAGVGAAQGTLAAISGGTSKTVTAGQVFVSAASSELPSANLHAGPISVSISPSFALSTTEGFSAGFNVGAGTGVGPLSFGTSIGASLTSGAKVNGLNGLNTRNGVFGGIGYGGMSVMGSSTTFRGSNPIYDQTHQAVRFGAGKFHLAYTNDHHPFNIGGEGTDRGRTFGLEGGWGQYVVGTKIYTSDRDKYAIDKTYESPIYGKNPSGTYATGEVHSSPFYAGIRSHGRLYAAGYDHPFFQDLFQNGAHRWLNSPSVPYFKRGNYSRFYGYSGTYNPFIY